MPVRVLIVEDEKSTVDDIVGALRAAPEHFETEYAASGREAAQVLRKWDDAAAPIACVILDLKLSDSRPGDFSVLRRIRTAHPRTPVIVVTAYGTEDVAVAAMKNGAADYVAKHHMWIDALPFKVREAVRRVGMQRDNEELRASFASSQARIARLERELRKRYRSDGIVGECTAIEQALLLAESAAHMTAPVVILGGPGTGKTLFARTIHAHSERANEPFEVVRCGAMGDDALAHLLEGERGGTVPGVLARTAGGTLFVADLEDMGERVQRQLLQVIEQPVDRRRAERGRTVRIIVGTRSHSESLVGAGRLRDAVGKVLSAMTIELPCLRDRANDVRLLADHFLRRAASEVRKPVRGLKLQALHLLERYDWRDNVRELESEIRRAVALTPPGEFVTSERLSPRIREASRLAPTDDRPLKEALRDVEATVIRSRLEAFDFNRTRTARSLGVSREWLWAKINQLNVLVRPRAQSAAKKASAAKKKEKP